MPSDENCLSAITITQLNNLPDEWLSFIFSFLRSFELHPLLLVCKKWHSILSPRWQTEVRYTKELRIKKREYYHYRAPLSVLYTGAELVKISGTTLSFVRISVKVQPRALGHSVGIVYTCDDWKTVFKWYGYWSCNANENKDELWKVRLWCFPENSRILFAVYVQDADGNRAWDNNNLSNYELKVKELATSREFMANLNNA